MKSRQHYKDNPHGQRLPENWNTVMPKEIKYKETKNGEALIVKMEDDEGRIATDFLYVDNADHNARINQLSEVANINWPDGTPGDDVADMFVANLFRFDVKIKWGKGDGCFVQEYAPASSQQKSVPAQPQAAQPAPTNGVAAAGASVPAGKPKF